jgi:hypothetical protein
LHPYLGGDRWKRCHWINAAKVTFAPSIAKNLQKFVALFFSARATALSLGPWFFGSKDW